jgi:hypothetical protein
MKRILLAAGLIAASPIPALASDWWVATRTSYNDPTWYCTPSAHSPAEVYYSVVGQGAKIEDEGNGIVAVCLPNVGNVFAQSQSACEMLGAALNQIMGKYR